MTLQNNLPFESARDTARNKLASLVKYAESLDSIVGSRGIGFRMFAENLETLKVLVETASGPVLSENQIRQVNDFGQALINIETSLAPKLQAFWSLYQDILQGARNLPAGQGYATSGIVSSIMPRIERADALASEVVSRAQKDTGSILSASGLLLINMIRVESIEYALTRQLQDAVTTFNLQGRYDIEEMCSVGAKVPKGSVWRTDVRAIRDATAHGHFLITTVPDDWQIAFDSFEDGYLFRKVYSRREFQHLIDLHTLLYKTQIHLMITVEALVYLSTHLYRGQRRAR